MIIRSYRCDDCEREFEVEFESGDMPEPDCPHCDKVLEWTPGLFAIKTHKSRAIDYTQKVIEEDYGLSNLKDNNREGDVAAYDVPPETTSALDKRMQIESEVMRAVEAAKPTNQVQQQGVENFWGAGGGAAGAPVAAASLMAAARAGPNADINPMKMLQDGIKSGQLPRKERIIARWRP